MKKLIEISDGSSYIPEVGGARRKGITSEGQTVQVSATVEQSLVEMLDRLMKTMKRSRSELISFAIEEFIKAHSRELAEPEQGRTASG